MKKTIVLLAGIALMAAGCTKTEVITSGTDGAQKGIGFSAYTAKPTKAAQVDVTTSNLNSFQVTAVGNSNGITLFEDVTFSQASAGQPWVSDPLYFWPNYALDFYAYNVPTNGTLIKDAVISHKKLTFTPSATLSEQEDLVAAYASDQTDPSGSTDLTFHHCLTQVIVKAKNSSASYKVNVDGVKLANFQGTGSYTFTDNKMTAEGDGIKYTASFTGVVLNDTASEMMTDGVNGRWYLVPQNVTSWTQSTDMKNTSKGTYLGLKVKITAPNNVVIYPAGGSETAWMAVEIPSELKFQQGKKYVVTLDFFSSLNGGAGYVDPEEPGNLTNSGNVDDDRGKAIVGGVIKFDASVESWENANTVNVTINL